MGLMLPRDFARSHLATALQGLPHPPMPGNVCAGTWWVARPFRMQLSSLQVFAETLKAKFALPGAASPEDQLKPPVADLLKAGGGAFGLTIETRTETHLSEFAVRPDVAVYVGGLICGYIELKAPGLGADAPKLKGE